MICPSYKEQVIAALLKAKGKRQMRQLLEYDYDISQIIKCDESECPHWRQCTASSFSYFIDKEEEI